MLPRLLPVACAERALSAIAHALSSLHQAHPQLLVARLHQRLAPIASAQRALDAVSTALAQVEQKPLARRLHNKHHRKRRYHQQHCSHPQECRGQLQGQELKVPPHSYQFKCTETGHTLEAPQEQPQGQGPESLTALHPSTTLWSFEYSDDWVHTSKVLKVLQDLINAEADARAIEVQVPEPKVPPHSYRVELLQMGAADILHDAHYSVEAATRDADGQLVSNFGSFTVIWDTDSDMDLNAEDY